MGIDLRKRPFDLLADANFVVKYYFCGTMQFNKFKIGSDQLFQLAFHVVLWATWIAWPLIHAHSHGGERFAARALWIIPLTLAHIPLFLINTELLIPRILRKQGVTAYLVSLLLLIGFFATFQYFFRIVLIPENISRRPPSIFWSLTPVIFATAISTGYGLILYLIKQDKDKQEEKAERLKSELSFLRSQISPHFIFNVLNSIVYLIRSKSELAEPVTIKLSELMRYTLYNSGSESVSLDKEIDYLRNYVELQKIRFEEDVDIRLNIQGHATDQTIEPMLLIPFVENAFKHGVGLIRDPLIAIDLTIDEQRLNFSIRNKVGPESQENKDSGSGIGLRNVKRRLELLYPDMHGLQIEESPEWFTVHLDLYFSSKLQYFSAEIPKQNLIYPETDFGSALATGKT